MRVSAYRNLNKPGVVYSLLDAKTGRVAGYAEDVILENVKFVVSEAGRQRVLREKRKGVHAYARGEVLSADEPDTAKIARTLGAKSDWESLRYNPYLFETFVRAADEAPVFEAKYARLNKDGLVAILPPGQPRFSGRLVRIPSKRQLLDEQLLWQG